MATKRNPTMAHLLGEMIWLMMQSSAHRNLSLKQIQQAIIPGLEHRQYRIFYEGDKPVAFVVWAMFSEKVEKKLIEQLESGKPFRLANDTWKSGDRPWLLEVISPYATKENKAFEQIVLQLANDVFKGKQMRFIKSNTKTGKAEIAILTPGKKAA